jgi:hypothetical protein
MNQRTHEPSLLQTILMYTVLGVVLTFAALAVAHYGIDYEMSRNCRSKTSPERYGVEYCVKPHVNPGKKPGF